MPQALITKYTEPRQILFGFELTEKERAQFLHIDNINAHPFVKYDKRVYDLDAFKRPSPNVRAYIPEFNDWDECLFIGDNTAIVIKYNDNFESITIGRCKIIAEEAA